MNRKELAIKLITGGLIFGSFWYLTDQILDPDFGWHLEVGKEILKTRSIPRYDIFSFSMPGYEWIDHEWAVEAFWAWMQNHHLWPLVVLLFSICYAAPFLYYLAQAKKFLDFWLVGFFSILSFGYLGVRPQAISFLFFFLAFEFLRLRYLFGKKWIVLILPVFFLVWANLHAGFITGLIMFGLFLSSSFLKDIKRLGRFVFRKWRLDILIFILSLAATLINPYGFQLYGEILRVLFSAEAAKYILEWQSAIYLPGLTSSVAHSFFLWLGLSVVGSSYSLLLIFYRKAYPFPFWVVSLFFFLGFIKTLKTGLFFFVTAISTFILGFQYLQEDVMRKRTGIPFSQDEQKFLLIAKYTLVLLIIGLFGSALWLGKGESYPETAAEFLRERVKTGETGQILNNYGWGGYLIWQLPEVKVFIDGRMPHWRDRNGYSAMEDYVKVFYPEGERWEWREVFDRHKISEVIMPNPVCGGSAMNPIFGNIVKRLNAAGWVKKYFQQAAIPCRLIGELQNANWQIIYQDEAAIILQQSKL